MLTVGSLFTGIAGFDLGLERAGMKIRWQCENDPFCVAYLDHVYPGTPLVQDVHWVSERTVPRVDVLAGGFPCQDIADRGFKRGIRHDTRSGLAFQFLRCVRELRPRYVIMENVASLLVRGRGFDAVLGELAACGYDAEWDCLTASLVGAPHERDRLFLVAYPHGIGSQGRRVFEAACLRRQSGDPSEAIRSGEAWWAIEPDVGRVAYGFPRGKSWLQGLGNAVVPYVAEFVGRCVMRHYLSCR